MDVPVGVEDEEEDEELDTLVDSGAVLNPPSPAFRAARREGGYVYAWKLRVSFRLSTDT